MTNFKCPFCKKSYLNKDALMEHMLDIHGDQLNGLPPQQVYFNYIKRVENRFLGGL